MSGVRVSYHPPFTSFPFINRFNPEKYGLYTIKGIAGVTVPSDYNPPRLVEVPSKGNIWYAYITKPLVLQSGSNKQVKRSTRTTDRREAEKRVNKIATTIYKQFDDSVLRPKSFYEIAESILATRDITLDLLCQNKPDYKVPDQSSVVMYLTSSNFYIPQNLLDAMNPNYVDEIKFLVSKGLPNANLSALINKNEAVDCLFSKLSQAYLSERKWNRKKTGREAKLALERFESCIGNIDVTEIKKAHAYRFASWFESQFGAANNSIKAGISYVKAFLTWCEQHEHISSDPFVELQLKTYGRAKQSYVPFSKNQLHSLFKLKLSARDRLILTILVTTGMRLDEAALLDWNNVKRHDEGFTYFDTRFGIVKNTGSERLIPLPNFINMPERGSGRLFDYSLDDDGKAQRQTSNTLNRHIEKIRENNRQVVHSLRETLKDLLRDYGVSKEINDFITGHSSGDVAGQYGSGPSLYVRYEAVNSVSHSWF